jgi:hypothetical protein
MANFVFNVAKGRVGQYHEQARTGTNGEALVFVVLRTTGLESDAGMMDRDTLADVLTASSEPTNTGYARKVLSGTSLTPLQVDDTNDRVNLDTVDVTWTSVAAGDNWAKLLICYRPSTTATDSQIIPMTAHDFAVTPDGSNIVALVNDYCRAS